MTDSRRRALRRIGAAGVCLMLPGCGRQEAPPAVPRAQALSATGALRLELRHHVSNGNEGFALARMRAEPRWAGPNAPMDAPDWGDYRVSVYAAGTDTVLHRSGFDSSLDLHAAAAATRLSVRLPAPPAAVTVAIDRRRPGNDVFTQVWRMDIDAASSDIDRSAPALATQVHAIAVNGDAAGKVDVAILGDGYAAADEAKFVADAKRAAGYLFSVEPLKTRSQDFNVHAVFTASAESGITDRYLGIQKNTVFGCAYGAGASERTLAPENEHAVRDAASAVAYDFILILANTRRYGGSAHFGGPATVAIDSGAARYLVVHEFAHVIGGLADEYYLPTASGPAYTGTIEPWNPNVTVSAAHAKWKATHSGASSWNKAAYDRQFASYVRRYFALRQARAPEAAVEQLMQHAAQRQAALLSGYRELRSVGLYEGANGYARGQYRSEADCIMFSLQTEYLCSACTAAINRMIAMQCGRAS